MSYSESISTNKLFEDIEEFIFGNFSIPVFINCSDKLVHFGVGDILAPTQTLKGIIDKVVDLVGLQSTTSVGVISVENAIDGLS